MGYKHRPRIPDVRGLNHSFLLSCLCHHRVGASIAHSVEMEFSFKPAHPIPTVS
jgi:hypothetical protein